MTITIVVGSLDSPYHHAWIFTIECNNPIRRTITWGDVFHEVCYKMKTMRVGCKTLKMDSFRSALWFPDYVMGSDVSLANHAQLVEDNDMIYSDDVIGGLLHFNWDGKIKSAGDYRDWKPRRLRHHPITSFSL